MFADIAYATEQAQPGGGLMGLAPLIIIFVIFYFLLIRPQQKKAKAHQEMVNNLKPGDPVITNGGLHGRLTRVDDNTVMMEVADKIRLKVSRQSIAALKENSQETNPAVKDNGKSSKKK